ncbi:MAG: serine--tRNA ligase [Candidatus Aenigmarchaeota archaeon]|nr:serine--tRNA ligase [Candidatus Aenigmarchaeota archaeon]
MLDIKLIREKPDYVRENLNKRGPEYVEYLNELLEKDSEWRALKTKNQELRHKRNILSKKIGELKAKGMDASDVMRDAEKIPEEIKKNEERMKELEERIRILLFKIPNLLHDSVPLGKDENDNVEIRRCGEPPKFSFKPKSHLEVADGLIDFAAGAKASGNGFTYLISDMVLLDASLQRFAIDFLMKKGFVLVEPPYMVNRKTYESMIGDPTSFSEASYKIEGEELYLIPTAEYPLGGMFIDRVLLKDELPIKLVGVSPCFRREVGTHGKYAKGLFRMHQFNKVEQLVISLPEDSWKFFDELQKNSEELYQKLGLHYRVVEICSGDIGKKQAKQYDIEVWMADGVFREVGSNSNCTDYQARRLNLKYREKEGSPPKGFVHILNNTAIATSRAMIAILEQYQQEDGSVKIPKVLQPYMGKDRIVPKKPL